MRGRFVILATAICRTIFETAAIYLWLGLLSGTPISFPIALGGAVALGLVARTGAGSRYFGPLAAIAMALVGVAFGIPVYATGPVLLYLSWRMQSVATQTISTYAIESSFALGLWLFVMALAAVDILPIRAGIPHDLGGDALTMVISGLLAMVFARSENLGVLARLKDAGLEGDLFRRTGMMVVASLALAALLLALIVSPSLGTLLGVISAVALFLAYWLIYLVGYVAAFLIPIWQWFLGLIAGKPSHTKPQSTSTAARKVHELIHHPAAAHAVQLILIILGSLIALYVLYRLFSRIASVRQDESLFTDERLAYRARPREAPAGGPADGWPYSPARTRLREAVRALRGRISRAGAWPGPSATLRDALAQAGKEAPRLVDAYEAHRYGDGRLPDDVDEAVREADALLQEGEGPGEKPPRGRSK